MSGTDGTDGGGGRRRPVAEGLRHRVARALFAFDPGHLAAVERRLDAVERHLAELVGELERLRDGRLPEAEARLDAAERHLGEVVGEVEVLRDRRLPGVEGRLDAAEAHGRELLAELERLRDVRLPAVEDRLGAAEGALAEVTADLAEVRDERLPAAVTRGDVLVDRLARELEEVASLVERLILREPLPLPAGAPSGGGEGTAPEGLAPRLLETLRGSEAEIRHRLEGYLPLLEGRAPVLDLGCGRGELLGLLAEAGIEAVGVEPDPALAGACRRRGLEVEEADAVAALEARPEGSLGAVCAIHLLEHLPPARLPALLAAARRALRPGGVLLVEVPDVETLRVGAAEFWLDPTHVRPLPARTVEVLGRAAGLVVRERRRLRPFPEEQRLAVRLRPALAGAPEAVGAAVLRLAEELDALLAGSRDVLVVLERPEAAEEV